MHEWSIAPKRGRGGNCFEIPKGRVVCAIICVFNLKWNTCVLLCAVFGHVSRPLKLSACNSCKRYWLKALYVPPELLPRGKIHSSNVPNKMQLFDLCCFQDVHPWSVRTNQSFCLTKLAKGWPLQWLGCPQQGCDVPVYPAGQSTKGSNNNTGRQQIGLVSFLVSMLRSTPKKNKFSVI